MQKQHDMPKRSTAAALLVVAVVMTLSLMGCGSNSSGPLPPGSTNGSATNGTQQ